MVKLYHNYEHMFKMQNYTILKAMSSVFNFFLKTG